MLFNTRWRVSAATDGLRLITALTVPTDTPARAATSLMVVARLTSYRPFAFGCGLSGAAAEAAQCCWAARPPNHAGAVVRLR
jgi:hypothetical protein